MKYNWNWKLFFSTFAAVISYAPAILVITAPIWLQLSFTWIFLKDAGMSIQMLPYALNQALALHMLLAMVVSMKAFVDPSILALPFWITTCSLILGTVFVLLAARVQGNPQS